LALPPGLKGAAYREFKSMLKLVALAGAVVLSCGAAAAATPGATPPDATYGASLGKYANFTSVSYFGVGTFNDGYSTVSLGSQPSPFIHAQAVGTLQNYNPSVSGDITYYVGVNGPDDGTFVPIDVAYTMSGQIVDNGAYDMFAQANLSLLSYYKGNPVSIEFVTHDGDFNVSGHVAWAVASGAAGQVHLNAHSGMVVDITGSGTADVSIDPVFTIDPTFAAQGYSLVVSQNAGNRPAAGGVPEPAAWALMLVGFGGVGAVLRRRGQTLANAT
jgi:hypothetical protein